MNTLQGRMMKAQVGKHVEKIFLHHSWTAGFCSLRAELTMTQIDFFPKTQALTFFCLLSYYYADFSRLLSLSSMFILIGLVVFRSCKLLHTFLIQRSRLFLSVYLLCDKQYNLLHFFEEVGFIIPSNRSCATTFSWNDAVG